MRARSARDVALREDAESAVAQRLAGGVGVFGADDERGAAFGAFDETVDVVNVDFSFEQRGEHALQLGFICDLDGEDGAFGVGKIVVHHQLAGFGGIVHDETHNRAVSGIEDGDRHHVDVVGLQQRGEFVEPTDAILDEDGELVDGVGGDESVGIGHKVRSK